MYTSHVIAREDHLRWFHEIVADDRRHAMVFELDDIPAGFMNIGPVRVGGIAEWGFYAAPGSPRGTGANLGGAGLIHAFEVLGLYKLCGSTLGENEASRRLHLSLGFRQEGVLVDQHFDGSRYHDVIRFGLLESDWQAVREGQDNASRA